MSADNWAQCPRCTRIGNAELEARDMAVQESYGVVPVADFDEARRVLEEDRAAFAIREPTFREDYEFCGAEDGTVTVGYHGECRECGLKLEFSEDHPIPDWDKS